MVAVLSSSHILNQIFQLSILFFSIFMPAQFFWYQNKKKPKNKTNHEGLVWHNGVPDGYSLPVPKRRSHCLWAPLSCSPGTREWFDIFLNFWKANEISRPMTNQIYFPIFRSIRRSCCCLFELFPSSQRKWSFQRKRAIPPIPWQDRRWSPYSLRSNIRRDILTYLHKEAKGDQGCLNTNRLHVSGAEQEL